MSLSRCLPTNVQTSPPHPPPPPPHRHQADTCATTQKSATTKLLPAVNVQPATAKLLPTANGQTPTTIEQMHTATAKAPAVVKNQQLGKYFSKVGYQVDHLEPSERSHNEIDCHHPSEDLGVDIITSKITSKIREYVVYEGVYCYRLSGVEKNQCGPGVQIGGVELCCLLVKVLTSWIIEWPMQLIVLVAPNP
ncbi:hypothetical protein DSO57_1037869 [Entomophthora muscae]|uniref:Uncharacterized protein n=1 Tax=Entomophthora muscae TaxID=34485 RepID=A0ACC2TLK1_9FUNG|nr:hypothetical protein DSO57_1037869 [Entomophthora muscae]